MSSGMNDEFYKAAETSLFGTAQAEESKELPTELPSKLCAPFVAKYYSGALIVLEGLDRTGKSTQAKLLAREFELAGAEVYQTHFPSGGTVGKVIYEMLNSHRTEMSELEIWVNHLCAHFCDMRENVLPALEAGKVVIADRWITSAAIYNGMTSDAKVLVDGELIDLTAKAVIQMEISAVRGIVPEVLFYFPSDTEAVQHNPFLVEARRNYDWVMNSSSKLLRGIMSPEEIPCIKGFNTITVDWKKLGIERTTEELFIQLARLAMKK